MTNRPPALDLSLSTSSASAEPTAADADAQLQMDENTLCPGCKRSVVDETGGVVVAFGQSFFHVDCFKCAKCRNQVTADTNLLLLSDGSPICSNCSYSCNVCQLPILDEAIMTGDDAYHAHCFKCKVCKSRIDELVFAKTSQGIYCMDCHNARVAKSRRHAQRKQEAAREAAAKAGNGTATAPGVSTTPATPAKPSEAAAPKTNGSGFPSSPYNSLKGRPSDRPSSRDQPPSSSSLNPSVASTSTVNKRRSVLPSDAMLRVKDQLNNGTANGSSSSAPSLAPSFSNASSSAASGSANVSPAAKPVELGGTTSKNDTPFASARSSLKLDATSNGANGPAAPGSPVDKRRSFNDQPLSVMFHRRPSSPAVLETIASADAEITTTAPRDRDSAGPSSPNLSVPEPTSRMRKRQSIDPSMILSGFKFGDGEEPVSTTGSTATVVPERSQTYPAPRGQSPAPGGAAPSPRQEYFDAPSLSRDGVSQGTTNSSYHSPPSSPGGLNTATASTNGATSSTEPLNLRNRAGSASVAARSTPDLTARPPLRNNATSDNVPTLNKVPPRNTSLQGAAFRTGSSSKRPGTGGSITGSSAGVHERLSPANRDRSNSRTRETGRDSPASGRRVAADVPRSMESDTDNDDAPPALPPKSGNTEDDRVGTPDEAGISGAARTSHATFITPALPPIRFSMSGELSDLLKNVGAGGSRPALDQLARLAEAQDGQAHGKGKSSGQADPETPSSAGSSNASASFDDKRPSTAGTTVEDDDDRTVLMNGLISPGMEGQESMAATPTFDIGFARPQIQLNGHAAPADEQAAKTLTLPREREVSGSGGVREAKGRNEKAETVARRVQEVLADAGHRKVTHVRLDLAFVQAIADVLEQRSKEVGQMKAKVDGAKRASQQYIDVAQTEYDSELKARRDAEAEVTRLRVLLSGQAARLSAMGGMTMQRELHSRLSQQMTTSLSSLEREMAQLRVERDMTLAEVEELASSRAHGANLSSIPEGITSSRSLGARLDGLKSEYQRELEDLVAGKEALLRECAELKASRDAFLEETTALNARNEELAKLNAQYARRAENMGAPTQQEGKRSLERARSPPFANQSVTSLQEEQTSPYVRVQKPDGVDVTPMKPRGFKWPGSKGGKEPTTPSNYNNQTAASVASSSASSSMNTANGVRKEHTFQQLNILRFTRCDHCSEKLWGSQYKCTGCNMSIHSRCLDLVKKICTGQSTTEDGAAQSGAPLPPSMMGRDLIEQTLADAQGGDRQIPVIVEKCIEAVECHAIDYEGIYRKTGGAGQTKLIQSLFERGDYHSFDLRDQDRFNDIAAVTSVLKTYFRQLPNPLLTFGLHERFMTAAHIKDAGVKMEAFRDIVAELPDEHYHTLRMLMLHLHRVAEHSEVNLMGSRNLGVVFGPTLLRSHDASKEFSDMAGKALSVEWLVEQAPTIFS